MSKNYLIKKNIVLIANGEFPNHSKPFQLLNNAKYIICCDGAANSLKKINKTADVIIGDLDSLNNELITSEKSKIIHIQNQNNNDLRKALNWISENMNIEKLSIIGSTGLREDHTIGNISTFLYKKYNFDIEILTNTGIFYVINNTKNIKTFTGQHVSLFSLEPNQRITTIGLKYELKNTPINLYSGTLNIAQNNEITIKTKLNIPLLVYLCYENEKN